jgi:hypothetical protein
MDATQRLRKNKSIFILDVLISRLFSSVVSNPLSLKFFGTGITEKTGRIVRNELNPNLSATGQREAMQETRMAIVGPTAASGLILC